STNPPGLRTAPRRSPSFCRPASHFPFFHLLVFRIAQKAWLLRRVETWERVIADSSVAKVRAKKLNAAAPPGIPLLLF
ncbi:MAG: hypothetical protein U5J83_15570, partial [Bryobacterales bacterium]|nr:hypothetical protein [Bryobacterales bacterium]